MHSLSLTKDVVLLVAGIATGSINSVAGGGMLIGFPVLVATGMPVIVANATGKLVVLPGQIASAIGYRRFWRAIKPKYFLLVIPAVLGGSAGALLLRHTSSAHFANIAPFLILAAIILFAIQPTLARLLHTKRHQLILPFATLVLTMFLISIYGGYFGIGFGFMMLSLLSFGGMKNIHHMNTLKNISATLTLIVVIAILSPGSFINWPAGLIMAVGTALGGYAGARLAPRIPAGIIRAVIIAFGLVAVWYFFAYHPL